MVSSFYKGDRHMINYPCYLVKKNHYEEIEDGVILCKTETNIAQNLRMPPNGTLIWVKENLAKLIKKNSNHDLNVIPEIKSLYIMQKSWNASGIIIGYINVDEYYKLDKNSLKNYEKGVYIYPVDYYSAVEYQKMRLKNKDCDKEAKDYINSLPQIPLKGNKLDFRSLEENIQPER